MTSLRTGALRLPMAAVGPPDPLPPLRGLLDGPFDVSRSPGLPADLVARASTGGVRTVLPYLLQNGYGRDRRRGDLRVVVLENETLTATFVPGLGGRLWSLVHRPSGRELLHANPVLQPANLALRGAWFAGGVEWNIGTRGHSPTTCEPLHAAVVDGAALRMWEWERMRGVVFQIDAWLPKSSPVLLVHVRLRNPAAGETPMYWWSNAAVVQTDGLRVLAPARRAFRTSYAAGTLDVVDVPEGRPEREERAVDYFYDVPAGERPWIAALDADGSGLAQVSTARLNGRKLFCWGASAGGRRWQEWLTPGGPPYAEIQAGLAPTQYEHVPMPGGATWSWTEAYGLVECDPSVVHGSDWSAATAEVARRLVPEEALAAWHDEASARADRAPDRMIGRGSGWGALERRRRAARAPGSSDPIGAATPFADETLGAEQAPWLALLERGELPEPDPALAPPSYVLGGDWSDRLARAPQHWATAYHLGVIAHAAGDRSTARREYERSLAKTPTAWAERALAILANDPALVRSAHERAPAIRQLAHEAIAAADPHDALALIDALPPALRAHGRTRLLEAEAAVAAGDRERAAAIVEHGLEVPDLREGEARLEPLWEAVFPGRALPARYDFRMT